MLNIVKINVKTLFFINLFLQNSLIYMINKGYLYLKYYIKYPLYFIIYNLIN